MGWIMGNQSGPQDRDWGWAGKECRREGGRDERKKEGERAVRDNGVAVFISLWIYMWEEGTEEEGGKDGEMDLGSEGGHLIWWVSEQDNTEVRDLPVGRAKENCVHILDVNLGALKYWFCAYKWLSIWYLYFAVLLLLAPAKQGGHIYFKNLPWDILNPPGN